RVARCGIAPSHKSSSALHRWKLHYLSRSWVLIPTTGASLLTGSLFSYFHQRLKPVHFTRSRAYRKNDNARVEQNNWTHVRQLIGYGRLEGEQVAELLNDLYAKEWSLFRNFFCPVMKHLRTEVEGSRKRRIYDRPATPFGRLKQSGKTDPAQLA